MPPVYKQHAQRSCEVSGLTEIIKMKLLGLERENRDFDFNVLSWYFNKDFQMKCTIWIVICVSVKMN